MKKFAKMAVAAAIAGLAMVSAHAALVIDDFSTTQTVISDIDGTPSSSTVAGAGILGGHRDLFVVKTADVSDDLEVNLRVTSNGGGRLVFSEDDGAFGYGVVRWDGAHFDGFATIDATGLGGVSLSDAGAAFRLVVTSADAGFPFTMNVYTDASNYTSLTLFSTGPGTYIVPFAVFGLFGTATGAGADFDNVGALEAIINTGGFASAVDLSVDIVDIPEPGTMALAGLALLGIGAARRRKQQA